MIHLLHSHKHENFKHVRLIKCNVYRNSLKYFLNIKQIEIQSTWFHFNVTDDGETISISHFSPFLQPSQKQAKGLTYSFSSLASTSFDTSCHVEELHIYSLGLYLLIIKWPLDVIAWDKGTKNMCMVSMDLLLGQFLLAILGHRRTAIHNHFSGCHCRLYTPLDDTSCCITWIFAVPRSEIYTCGWDGTLCHMKERNPTLILPCTAIREDDSPPDFDATHRQIFFNCFLDSSVLVGLHLDICIAYFVQNPAQKLLHHQED